MSVKYALCLDIWLDWLIKVFGLEKFFFIYLFLFWNLVLKWFRVVMWLILQSTYHATNHIYVAGYCLWAILLHISYISYSAFFIFVYRTSSRCFFTYILFEFSSTIYTQGHNIIFSLLQILFLPVVYAIPSSLFSHNCFSYSNTVTLIA